MSLQQKNIKFLIADDSALVRRMVTSSLEQMGFSEFDEACDGADALSKLDSSKYDLVILDWTMPKMTGYDVLRETRANKGTNQNTPVIMVTGEVAKKKIVDVLKLGISGYIMKPFDSAVFEKKVIEVLKK